MKKVKCRLLVGNTVMQASGGKNKHGGCNWMKADINVQDVSFTKWTINVALWHKLAFLSVKLLGCDVEIHGSKD